MDREHGRCDGGQAGGIGYTKRQRRHAAAAGAIPGPGAAAFQIGGRRRRAPSRPSIDPLLFPRVRPAADILYIVYQSRKPKATLHEKAPSRR